MITKRLELLFLAVFAFPKASNIGFVCNISYSMPLPPPSEAKYCIAILAVSVLPAPLSPLQQWQKKFYFYFISGHAIKLKPIFFSRKHGDGKRISVGIT
jgi:hypothetical protein